MNRVRGCGGRFNAGPEGAEDDSGNDDSIHMPPTMVPIPNMQQVKL